MQVSRLNEALMVATSAMTDVNLKAVDRVVRIVRALDRYHGFSAARRRLPEASSLETPVQGTSAFGAALFRRPDRPEFAPQGPEKIEFAPGMALAPGADHPAEPAPEASAPASLCERDERPENPPQALETMESAPGLARAPDDAGGADAARRVVRAGARPDPWQAPGNSAASP